jgi:hypothetical protein
MALLVKINNILFNTLIHYNNQYLIYTEVEFKNMLYQNT